MSTTITPRTASVLIYQGDDLERLSELRRAAELARVKHDDAKAAVRAEQRAATRIGDGPSAESESEVVATTEVLTAAQSAYDEFVEGAAERAVEVRVKALGRRPFRSLMAEHPARKVKDAEGKESTHEDDELGVNVEEFPDPLAKASLVDPTFDTPADRDAFLDNLSEGDFERLWQAAYWLNRSPGGDPKELRYSALPPSSPAT